MIVKVLFLFLLFVESGEFSNFVAENLISEEIYIIDEGDEAIQISIFIDGMTCHDCVTQLVAKYYNDKYSLKFIVKSDKSIISKKMSIIRMKKYSTEIKTLFMNEKTELFLKNNDIDRSSSPYIAVFNNKLSIISYRLLFDKNGKLKQLDF